MRRPIPSPTGSKFTVRGQVYVQTGAFFHPMGNDREVRVLELATTCPECSAPFQATASMRQIKTRQLVRRCPRCRHVHTGPVPIVAPAARKARKKPTGPKARKPSRRPPAVVREFEPRERITLLEIRPVDKQPGETPVTALYKSVLGMLDEPAEPPAESEQHQRWRDALSALD
jgi:predicted Zn finger-like uncharacterized protein